MSFDYTGLLSTADDLITRFGRTVTLKRPSQTPDDPAKPWAKRQDDATATDDISVSTIGVFLDPKRGNRVLSSSARPTSEVSEKEARLLLTADSDFPSDVGPDWYVIDDDGTRWDLLDIKPIRPGPTLLYFDARVRL